MPSTVICGFRYDERRRRLTVTFVSGEAYAYENVPPEVTEDFRAAPSKGRSFGRNIRDRYPYHRVTEGSVH